MKTKNESLSESNVNWWEFNLRDSYRTVTHFAVSGQHNYLGVMNQNQCNIINAYFI